MNDHTPTRPIHFEGRPVNQVKWKVTGVSPALMDLDGQVASTDDRVQMAAIFTVVKVSHEVAPNGDLVRVQYISPIEMARLPFDENDPNDDGILRAIVPGHTE